MSVSLVVSKGVALLTLDRQEALNALSFSILKEIGEVLDDVAHMPGVRALLVVGAGDKAFCAGADIKELRHRDLMSQKRGSEFGQSVFAKLDALPIASVALINGYAFGGGMELALACTFRIGSPDARFALPEIKLGLIPGYGGTQRLPRLVGEARALEILMTGRKLNVDEALAIGLVNRIVTGDMIEAGRAFAEEFTGYSLPVFEMTRRAVQRGYGLSLRDGLALEADLSTLAYQTADAEEGMAAFQEKRHPEFRDE